MKRRESGHAVLIVAIVIIAVIVLGLLGWVFWQNFNKSNGSSVANFEQCKNAPGSIIQETYPERCITVDGRSFTGPLNDESVVMATYCAAAEKICFEYRDDWTIQTFEIEGQEPGAKSDMIEVSSPNKEIVLTLETGIGGLGGTCPEENKVDVTVQTAVPIVGLTGYETEYSRDMLMVSRVYYPKNDNYVASFYVSGSTDYTTPQTLSACGIGFSQFSSAKNAVLSADFEGAGVFRFGLFDGSAGSAYSSEAEAKAAFESDVFRQGVSLLASLHYQ